MRRPVGHYIPFAALTLFMGLLVVVVIVGHDEREAKMIGQRDQLVSQYIGESFPKATK